ncbi:clan AA aspartic protease [Chryseobacterium sp. StRB126]|uniref:clan AA aspartic protease n=1 Tax=Chryseobacterium sp. StRB126 TaxID=878220 RepID=UPI000A8EEE53|nr:clan AA aspartic protease [Chryseobacterium sp. StRB126]
MSFKDTLQLHINEQNTIFVKTVLNKVDTLLLNFDTGTSDLVLTQETLKNKIKSSLKSGTNFLQIGKKEYRGFNIYPAQLTGHGTDGRFGWDLFDGMVVELNHDKGLMVVHSQLPSKVKSEYSQLPIKYYNNVFQVPVDIAQDQTKNKDWYLFDTGYQRTAMLDGPLLNEQGFPTDKMTVIKKVIMKGAQGNEIPVMTSNLQTLSLGKTQLKDIPVQLLSQSRPVTGTRMNILGNEILKRFNIFLDFQKNIVYLKPNKLVNVTYIESK